MALHTNTPIYKQAYALLDLSTDLTQHLPRNFRRLLGEAITSECIKIVLLIMRANIARNKVPYIEELLEHLEVTTVLLRLLVDKRMISRAQFAKAIEITESVGKQAGGWKKSSATSPAA